MPLLINHAFHFLLLSRNVLDSHKSHIKYLMKRSEIISCCIIYDDFLYFKDKTETDRYWDSEDTINNCKTLQIKGNLTIISITQLTYALLDV